jgi:hypothetical protein
MNRIDETLAFEADRTWIDANLSTLMREHAEHWIAVKDGRVIASEADLGELLSKVPDLAHTCVEFINSRPTEEI